MPDQTIDIDAIRQRERAATEGPWRAAWPKGLHPWEVCISADVPLVELAHGEQGIADAEFIAHAREDIPALLAERDRLAAELAQAHAVIDATRQMAIDANTRLRTQLLTALDREDDGRTPLSSYVSHLVAQRNALKVALAKTLATVPGSSRRAQECSHACAEGHQYDETCELHVDLRRAQEPELRVCHGEDHGDEDGERIRYCCSDEYEIQPDGAAVHRDDVARYVPQERHIHAMHVDAGESQASEPAPKMPCPEGFHWIGQRINTCDKCGLPAWEHAGMSEARDKNNPFSLVPDDEYWVLRPWKPGEADAIRRKWDPEYAEATR